MYGYKPPAARRLAQLPQQLADGGLVARMKSADAGPAVFGSRGLSQLRDMIPKMQAMGYSQQAAAPDQATNPRAAQLMAMIPQMEAMGFKQQPQMLARGGIVRGPGTGTSDSIQDEAEPGTYIMPADSTAAIGPSALEKMGTVPVQLSDGEFKMPPEQVMALGTAVLNMMKDATHTPARGFAPKAKPDDPRQFFSSGGLVEDENPKRPNSFGDAAAVARDPSTTQVAAAPTALGQMHNPNPRSGVQMLASGLDSGARAFFGSFGPTQEKPAPAAPTPTTPNPTDIRLAAGTQSTPMSATQAAQTLVDAAASTPAPTQTAPPATAPPAPAAATGPGEVTRVGNSYSGTNVSGDISINGQAPRNGGQVSAQNDAAWQRLADRSQADSMARVSAQQPAGFTPTGMQAPTVRHSGNDWQSRNDLRNAMVSATSIMNDGGKWDKHGKGVVSPERAYAMGLAQTDATLRGAQPGVDVAAMRENAGIQRTGMQETGATTRTGMTEQGANARESGRSILARDEFNLRKEASGFQTRAAQQQEQLRNVLLDPKATPEQRAVAQRNLAALSGKTAADRMQTVALPDTTNEMGQVVRGGQALVRTLEDGSVQQVPIGRQGQAGAAAPQVGTVQGGYRFKGGDPSSPASWEKA